MWSCFNEKDTRLESRQLIMCTSGFWLNGCGLALGTYRLELPRVRVSYSVPSLFYQSQRGEERSEYR